MTAEALRDRKEGRCTVTCHTGPLTRCRERYVHMLAVRTWSCSYWTSVTDEARNASVDVLVIQIQGHSMTDEVLGTRFETELLVDSLHGVLVQVDACIHIRIMSDRVHVPTLCTHLGEWRDHRPSSSARTRRTSSRDVSQRDPSRDF